jgi:hypothetical protein
MMPTSAVWLITSKALFIPLNPLYKNSNDISIYACSFCTSLKLLLQSKLKAQRGQLPVDGSIWQISDYLVLLLGW